MLDTATPTAPRTDTRYEAVIGLEVHAQLLTQSKAFSPEGALFGLDPNVQVDPVSLGHPGTLPTPNAEAVTFAARVGLATGCAIRERSIFARKHYFYPDLPKGYQITQYDTPLCEHGSVDVEQDDGSVKTVGITRIHLEEDAGKSIHDQDPYDSLIDYNRSSVPLIEIVSEPDMRTPREAYRYLQKIRQIVRYLGVCDGNMDEGSLRCDANVSVRPVGQAAFGTKTEVKNMNSIRNVERAIAYEIERQIALIEGGGEVEQVTMLWDAGAMQTRPMRSKEQAHDYRYFPDPDLVTVVVDDALLAHVREGLPELPAARRVRYTSELGLPAYDAGVLTEERELADFFEATLDAAGADHAKAVSNLVMGDVLKTLNERSIGVAELGITPERLAALVHLRASDAVSSTGAQRLFELMQTDDADPKALAQQHDLLQVSDTGALAPLVDDVIAQNPDKVAAYRSGKKGLIGFFMGQVMQRFDGSPDPRAVRELLAARLDG
jgi:aspartyl-tRNA(Asn)/glutamyl-tRNA(Gln) amidotransferase subunit B